MSGPWQKKEGHCGQDASSPETADKWRQVNSCCSLLPRLGEESLKTFTLIASPQGLTSSHLIFLLWPVILFHYKSACSRVSER